MCLEQEYKPRSRNTKLKSKNHKPKNTNTNPATNLPFQPNTKATNTNPAIDFSCQPNTKTINTNPNISKNTNTNPAIHLPKTQIQIQISTLLTAEMSVVHAREIVLDESRIMDHLDGASGGHGHGFNAADEFAGSDVEEWADSLATEKEGIAHGLVELMGFFVFE